MLEETGLKAGVDFHLVFSPERVDPPIRLPDEGLPKVVGGSTRKSTDLACLLYGQV